MSPADSAARLTHRTAAAFLCLLADPLLAPADLADRMGLDTAQLAGALAELAELGLLHPAETPSGFRPHPPEVAATRLLTTPHPYVPTAEDTELDGPAGVTELPAGLAVAGRCAAGVRARADRWLMAWQPADTGHPAYLRPTQIIALARRGVAVSVVYRDPADVPAGVIEGFTARVHTDPLPPMVLADRSRAVLLPTRHAEPCTLIRGAALVGPLLHTFDTVWRLAEPAADPRPPAFIVGRLADGLKDDAIARQLGVSSRTVRRHIADLLSQVGASTRAQAGYALGRPRPADDPD